MGEHGTSSGRPPEARGRTGKEASVQGGYVELQYERKPRYIIPLCAISLFLQIRMQNRFSNSLPSAPEVRCAVSFYALPGMTEDCAAPSHAAVTNNRVGTSTSAHAGRQRRLQGGSCASLLLGCRKDRLYGLGLPERKHGNERVHACVVMTLGSALRDSPPPLACVYTF